MNRLIQQLKRHEGFRGMPYLDTEGELTIGYGRNLEARPLTEDEATYLLVSDLPRYEARLLAIRPLVASLDPVRRAALLNMAYNLGTRGLRKFRRMWTAIEQSDWERAADEAMDSRWARQVKGRAHDIAYMLRTGQWPAQDQ